MDLPESRTGTLSSGGTERIDNLPHVWLRLVPSHRDERSRYRLLVYVTRDPKSICVSRRQRDTDSNITPLPPCTSRLRVRLCRTNDWRDASLWTTRTLLRGEEDPRPPTPGTTRESVGKCSPRCSRTISLSRWNSLRRGRTGRCVLGLVWP